MQRLALTFLLQNSSQCVTVMAIRPPFRVISTRFPKVSNQRRRYTRDPNDANDDTAQAWPRTYLYNDILELLNEISPTSRALIDVREPDELLKYGGTIPGSLNIPFISSHDAYYISSEAFRDRFGFDRPAKEVELVFFCHSGVRSFSAAILALKAGWSHVGNYRGSWLDWEKHGGMKELVMPK